LLWGWKDPRLALFIEEIYDHLNNPFFIICLRNPRDIAISLKKRDKIDVEKGLKLINVYYHYIHSFLKNHSKQHRIYLEFDSVRRQPIVIARKISDYLGIPITKEQERNINTYVIKRRLELKKRKGLFLLSHILYHISDYMKQIVPGFSQTINYIKRAVKDTTLYNYKT
jgi:hypothetical protein